MEYTTEGRASLIFIFFGSSLTTCLLDTRESNISSQLTVALENQDKTMFLQTNSTKSKFLNKYFQSVIQGGRFPTDGPLQMKRLTIEDLAALSRECVSCDYPRMNRSVLEEVLDDFHLESYDSTVAPESPMSSNSTSYSYADVKNDFIEYVKTLRPQPTISNTLAKTNLRTQSYSTPSTIDHKSKSDFRKTQSLQSVVSHISATTSSSATDSDYSIPTTDDEEFLPVQSHSGIEDLYVLGLDKGKLPEPHSRVPHQTFVASQQEAQIIVSSEAAVFC